MESKIPDQEQEIYKTEQQITELAYLNSCANCGEKQNTPSHEFEWVCAASNERVASYLMKKIRAIGLRSVRSLGVYQLRIEKIFHKFLKTCCVSKIYQFHVFMKNKNARKNGYYLRMVINLIPKVTCDLTLSCLIISHNNLKKIIQVGRHLQIIRFASCYLNLKKFKLSDSLHYLIECIDLVPVYKNLSQSFIDFRKDILSFIKELSLTDLKCSLKQLRMSIPLEIERVDKYASELNFKSLEFHHSYY
ncbi:unnamed protein product [Moneuplotes crassus]|uniref:Uncharacterized protein n=1 Tax=Euplotes crassus TaxID=5936 RepID=A0AAD1XVC0_EUPCR|nr:unnamed protein product [Moneuplotes crassus]